MARLIQAQAGVDTEAFERMVSEAFRPELSTNEMAFVERRTFSVAASIDETGRRWASPLLAGDEQLFVVADPTTVQVTAQNLPGDPLRRNITERGELGVLYFDPSLRRRAKSIGTATVDGDTITYRMGRNFGLCNKYIFKRSHEPTSRASTFDRPSPTVADRLATEDRQQLQSADTIFLASHHVVNGADATHRGGREGFVSIVDNKTIAIPDYVGNGMFNTLGNLQIDPRIGVLNVDFVTGRTVQLTGTATLTTRCRSGRF